MTNVLFLSWQIVRCLFSHCELVVGCLWAMFLFLTCDVGLVGDWGGGGGGGGGPAGMP